jgi:hypothetical protein
VTPKNNPLVVFDIDMTLTSEWYYEDNVATLRANLPLVQLAVSLAVSGVTILISTARPNRLRADSENWLQSVGVKFDAIYMRKDGDDRPDHYVKTEQALAIIEDFGRPSLWYDDNQDNCKVVRELGIPCVQVMQ